VADGDARSELLELAAQKIVEEVLARVRAAPAARDPR
jgi:hypothetical protein